MNIIISVLLFSFFYRLFEELYIRFYHKHIQIHTIDNDYRLIALQNNVVTLMSGGGGAAAAARSFIYSYRNSRPFHLKCGRDKKPKH